MERNGTPLNMACALALISETLRFWTDEELGLDGKMYPPRCFDVNRSSDMRESLIKLDSHCKTSLRAFQKDKDAEPLARCGYPVSMHQSEHPCEECKRLIGNPKDEGARFERIYPYGKREYLK